MQWDVLKTREVLKTVPFTLEEIHLKDRLKPGPNHPYHRLLCPDWVNILPITDDGRAILIRQSRAGNMQDVLEVPGGVVDVAEKNDTTMAAARELEEETGFTSQRILPLGAINPNPAINNNRLHMFLALGCTPAVNRKHFADEGEAIEVVMTPARDLDGLVRMGRIDSCLSALTIMLATKYVDIGSGKL